MPNFPSEYETAGTRMFSVEYNLEQKEFVEKKYKMTLKDLYNDAWNGHVLIGLFVCPNCGGNIELSALKFYGFDVVNAKCFSCQGLHFKS